MWIVMVRYIAALEKLLNVADIKPPDELAKTNTLAKTITNDASTTGASGSNERRVLPAVGRLLSRAVSMEAASSAFALGSMAQSRSRSGSRSVSRNTMARTTSRASQQVPYLSYQPTIGRNSVFIDLDDDERDELGGIEYRSLRLIAKITGRKCCNAVLSCV